MKNKIFGTFAILLLLLSSLVLADSNIALTASWDDGNGHALGNLISVQDGDNPTLAVLVTSNSDFRLWIQILDAFDQSLVNEAYNLEVPANINSSYVQTFEISTEELNGAYQVLVSVSNVNGTARQLLTLIVNGQVDPVDPVDPDPVDPSNTSPRFDMCDNDGNGVADSLCTYVTQENVPFTLTLHATDAENDQLTYSVRNYPSGQMPAGARLNFVTGVFNWRPTFEQAGTYQFFFTASDGQSSDGHRVRVIVQNVNRAPVVEEIADQTVVEGESITPVTISAVDADGDSLNYSIMGMPAGANFNEDTGEFTWRTVVGDVGNYTIVLTATDSFADSASTSFTVTVQELITPNNLPVFAAIDSVTEDEGILVEIPVMVTDSDGDDLTLGTSKKPRGSSFVDNGDGTGLFSWTPEFNQSGDHVVVFTANDGQDVVEYRLSITINNVNQAPRFVESVGVQTVWEGQELSFRVRAEDPDASWFVRLKGVVGLGAPLDYSVNSMDTEVADAFDIESGLFSWTPAFDFVLHPEESRKSALVVSVTDGESITEMRIIILVTDSNRAPEFVTEEVTDAVAAEPYSFTFEGVDADSEDVLTFALDQRGLDLGMTLEDGVLNWMPVEGDFLFSVTVSDNVEHDPLSAEREFSLHVEPAFQPMTATVDVPAEIMEGQEFTLSAVVRNGVLPISTKWQLDGGAIVEQESLLLNFVDEGTHQLKMRVADATGQVVKVTSELVVLNASPVVEAGANQNGLLNELFNFEGSFTDAGIEDTHTVAWDFGDGNFADTLNAEHAYADLGEYTVTLTVTDNDGGVGSDSLTITVTEVVNEAPVFISEPVTSAVVGVEYSYTPAAIDAENDSLTFDLLNTPDWLSLVNGVLSGTPDTVGDYVVTISVTDGLNTVTQTFTITVTEPAVNEAPTMVVTGNLTINEGERLLLTITTADPENDTLSLSYTETLPREATLTLVNENVSEFAWDASFEDAGGYTVSFTVTDGVNDPVTQTVVITVVNIVQNSAPVLEAMDNRTLFVGEHLLVDIHATDVDGDQLTFTVENKPAGASFVDYNDGSATLVWSPAENQVGEYEVTFIVSDGELSDRKSITISVLAKQLNGVPKIISSPVDVGRESEPYFYQVKVVDDGPVTYSLTRAPEGMVISSTGLITWTPTRQGEVQVTVAVSDGEFVVLQRYTIRVRDAGNHARIMSFTLHPEVVYPGEYIVAEVGIENEGWQDLDNLEVSIFIPDLGVYSSTELDLNGNDDTSESLLLSIPYYTEPREYLVQVSLTGDGFEDTMYRLLYVE